MLVVLSPAKKLNMNSSLEILPTTPMFTNKATELASIANSLTLTELQDLMGISVNLAKLNAERFASFGDQKTKAAAFCKISNT